MKCKKCGKEFKITTHGTECPSCYTVYKFTHDEMEALYEDAIRDESRRKYSSAAIKYKFLSYEDMGEAQYRYAECKEYGRGVKQNLSDALELYRSAAKKMIPEASYAVYRLFSEKKVKGEDCADAYYRLRVAAELDLACAQSALADCYLDSSLGESDASLAFYWYYRAHKGGDSYATMRASQMCAEAGDGEGCGYFLSFLYEDKKYKKQAKRLSKKVGADNTSEPPLKEPEDRGRSLCDLAFEAELRQELSVAFYFLLRSSECGYVKAQLKAAKCYSSGVGTKSSPNRAFALYEMAARSGSAEALLALAECYRTGFGVEKNNEKCIECYTLAAETGDARATYLLADALFEGKLCERDMPLAVKLYQRAALKTYAPAVQKINEIFDSFTKIFNSALEYQKAGDDVTAVRLYTIAAQMGHRSSACNLGYCYQNGIGCKKDLKLAVHYYTIAAEDGSASAKFNLGMCYKQGGGVNVDFRKAEKLLREASESGFYGDAVRLLEEIETRRMKKRARAVYSAATVVYRRGEVEQAIKLRIKAAKMGSARAEYMLGCHFEYGDGLPKDEEKAKYYYKKAREHGFRDILLETKLGFLREKRLLEYRS